MRFLVQLNYKEYRIFETKSLGIYILRDSDGYVIAIDLETIDNDHVFIHIPLDENPHDLVGKLVVWGYVNLNCYDHKFKSVTHKEDKESYLYDLSKVAETIFKEDLDV